MGPKPKTKLSKKLKVNRPFTKTFRSRLRKFTKNAQKSRYFSQKYHRHHDHPPGLDKNTNPQNLVQTKRKKVPLPKRKQRKFCSLACSSHLFQLQRMQNCKYGASNDTILSYNGKRFCKRPFDPKELEQHKFFIIPRHSHENPSIPLFMPQQFQENILQKKSDTRNFNTTFNKTLREAQAMIQDQSNNEQNNKIPLIQRASKNCHVCRIQICSNSNHIKQKHLTHIKSNKHLSKIKRSKGNKLIHEFIQYVQSKRKAQALQKHKIIKKQKIKKKIPKKKQQKNKDMPLVRKSKRLLNKNKNKAKNMNIKTRSNKKEENL